MTTPMVSSSLATGPLFGMAMARLRDPGRAREAAVDALTAGYLSLSRLKEPSRFGSWVRTILHRSCLKQLRACHTSATLDPDLPAGDSLPDRSLEERGTALRLRQCLDGLSPGYREPVVLHYFQGFSIAEISCWMNLPEGTVKRRLHDARQKLKAPAL